MDRTNATLELDHVFAAVYGLWDFVIPDAKLFRRREQLALPLKGPRKAEPPGAASPVRVPKPGDSGG
jgi:hypothetical protein